jgi:hypothetical protein
MSATGHKQLPVTILNLHCRNVSILIVTFLFITYVKLPGSKRKGIQIPLHITAAFTTHSTNTKNIIDRSGVLKKSLSSNSSCKMSVDTNATIGEKDDNVIESVQDGVNELLRDVSSSAINSMKETTVSHLNKSRQI